MMVKVPKLAPTSRPMTIRMRSTPRVYASSSPASSDPKAAEKAAKRQAKEKTGLDTFMSHVQGRPSIDAAVSLLKEAMRTKQTPPPLVLGAAKWLEDQGLPVDASAVRGTYSLVFSTVTPLNYIPVDEYLAFTDEQISMYSQIGPLKAAFSGGFKVAPGTSASIDYALPKMHVTLFGSFTLVEKVREQSTNRQYTFLYVDDKLAVARSSAGGITVLYKP